MPRTWGIFRSTGREWPWSLFPSMWWCWALETWLWWWWWRELLKVKAPWWLWCWCSRNVGRSLRSLKAPLACFSFIRLSRWALLPQNEEEPFWPSKEWDWLWLSKPADSRLDSERAGGWLRRRCFWLRSSSLIRSERASGGLKELELT